MPTSMTHVHTQSMVCSFSLTPGTTPELAMSAEKTTPMPVKGASSDMGVSVMANEKRNISLAIFSNTPEMNRYRRHGGRPFSTSAERFWMNKETVVKKVERTATPIPTRNHIQMLGLQRRGGTPQSLQAAHTFRQSASRHAFLVLDRQSSCSSNPH